MTILGRQSTIEELHLEECYAYPFGHTIERFFVSSEYQAMLRLATHGVSFSKATREDVILLYGIFLLRFPESEAEILRGMHSASLTQVAAGLIDSDEFRDMETNFRATRARPRSETTLASLCGNVDLESHPSWLRELLNCNRKTTLFQLWMRQVRKPGFLRGIRGGQQNFFLPQKKIPTILCFGTGSMATNLIPALDRERIHIAGFIDETQRPQGVKFMGAPVVGLASINEIAYDYILVCARPYERIKNKLLDSGVPEAAIVPGDIEATMRSIASDQTPFLYYLDTVVRHSSLLRELVDAEKLSASDWVSAANVSFLRVLGHI